MHGSWKVIKYKVKSYLSFRSGIVAFLSFWVLLLRCCHSECYCCEESIVLSFWACLPAKAGVIVAKNLTWYCIRSLPAGRQACLPIGRSRKLDSLPAALCGARRDDKSAVIMTLSETFISLYDKKICILFFFDYNNNWITTKEEPNGASP